MATEIRLPQLGESVHEGTIGRWLKKPGDRVAKYEPLVEVITDKVNVEMPSPAAGVLRAVLVEEGRTVPTGTVIAVVEEESASSEASAAQAASPDGERVRAPAEAGAPEHAPRLSPLVRRLVEEHGIAPAELASIRGSGAGGRITKDDVLRYLASRPAPAAPAALAPQAPPGPPAPAAQAPGDELVPLSPLRRTIAERMARSAREIPHAYGIVEVDVTRLVRHREAHKELWRQREGVRVSVTAFLIRAATRALRAYPVVNATFTPEGILLRRAIHFGVGVAVPDGLIVPVIKDADRKSVVGLARELEELVARARQGTLTLDDVTGGTFTLTNPGVFGSVYSMPIINYPQAAILAADAIVRRPVVVGDGIAIREIMHLGLAFDHRVFDGAVAMQFLTHIKRQLEEFSPAGDSPEF